MASYVWTWRGWIASVTIIGSAYVFLDHRWIRSAMESPGWDGTPDQDAVFFLGVAIRVTFMSVILFATFVATMFVTSRFAHRKALQTAMCAGEQRSTDFMPSTNRNIHRYHDPYAPPAAPSPPTEPPDGAADDQNQAITLRRFRYRLIPATLCLLFGVALTCMAAFWGYEIWNTTIASDHDIAIRAVPPVLFCAMALGGSSLIVAFRLWMRGYWRWAVSATAAGPFFVFVAVQICMQIVPARQ